MKQLLAIHIFLISIISYSQTNPISNLLPSKELDSIQFSIWNIQTKDMSSPNSKDKEYEKKLATVTLSNKDKDLLITNLLNPKSYNQKRALLYHYNLIFDLYKNDAISAIVKISTLTGNIAIDNKITGQYSKNNCTVQFGKVLLSLLKEYNFSDYLNTSDLIGISDNTNDKH